VCVVGYSCHQLFPFTRGVHRISFYKSQPEASEHQPGSNTPLSGPPPRASSLPPDTNTGPQPGARKRDAADFIDVRLPFIASCKIYLTGSGPKLKNFRSRGWSKGFGKFQKQDAIMIKEYDEEINALLVFVSATRYCAPAVANLVE
jgi:hypothetical protein